MARRIAKSRYDKLYVTGYKESEDYEDARIIRLCSYLLPRRMFHYNFARQVGLSNENFAGAPHNTYWIP